MENKSQKEDKAMYSLDKIKSYSLRDIFSQFYKVKSVCEEENICVQKMCEFLWTY